MDILTACNLVGFENVVVFYENGKGFFYIIGSPEVYSLD